ncbi:MAG TPA: DUF998 domain-containing protein [Candidatus Sulfotelmatobacter sp.]|nr:DUF998 domain-containing protein [Candidatus Sulfotelmatobacter sp.]
MWSSVQSQLREPSLSSADDPRPATGQALVGGLLLACGVIGPPVNIAVFTVEGALRPEYSPIRDFTSFLSLGPYGWVNVANFIVLGLLMTAFAAGVRTVIRTGPAAPAGPIVIAVSGLGLIAAGVFVADPGPNAVTVHGSLHIAASIVFLAAMTAACFVVAAHYDLANGRRFAAYSRVTGVAFAGLFTADLLVGVGIAGLLQRIGILVICSWIVLLAVRLIQEGAMGSPTAKEADET